MFFLKNLSRMGCQHTPCWCHCWFIYWRSTGRQVWQDKDFPIRCYPTYHWSCSYVCIISLTISFSTDISLLKTNASKRLECFQCYSPDCPNNDNWPLTGWYWNWYIICYCSTLHIWGKIFWSSLFALVVKFSGKICWSSLYARSRQLKSVVHLDL